MIHPYSRVYNWRRYRVFDKQSEALNQANRVSLLLGYITRVEKDDISDRYYLMIADKVEIKPVNHTLGVI